MKSAYQEGRLMAASAIDIHPHVISTDTARYPRAPVGGHQSDWSRDRPVSADEMIAAMDRAGVEKSALVQASTCYGHDNSYVAEAVKAHPDRFTGVFSADVLSADAPERMVHWMSRGLTGLRLFTTGSTMPDQADWLDDPHSFPAWELAQARKLPVCLQMTAKAIPQLKGLLARFPRVRVVLDHCARPTFEDGPPYAAADALWSLAAFPNVFLKITPRNFQGARAGKATPESVFGRMISDFGASRIAWGSNYPASEGSLSELLNLAQDSLAFLSETDREWIFRRTAQELYPVLGQD
jgi:predicted TIM-barrel fold metal-dependent hydrolase